MKSVTFFALICCCAATAWPQNKTTPSLSPAGPTPQLKLRGPDAVAQEDPGRVVATVNGKQITAKQADEILKALPPQDRQRYQANLQALFQQIYMELAVADDAVKMGLDQQEPWKEQLELSRANVLTQAYINKIATSAPTTPGADPKQYYDSHPAEFDQVKISGILIGFSPPGTPASGKGGSRTEAEAQDKANDLEKKLQSGGDFAA